MRTYTVRKLRKPRDNGDGAYEACSLAVPAEIAKELPNGIRFTSELTKDGILYRPVKAPAPTELPEWLQEDEPKDEPKPAAKAPAKK